METSIGKCSNMKCGTKLHFLNDGRQDWMWFTSEQIIIFVCYTDIKSNQTTYLVNSCNMLSFMKSLYEIYFWARENQKAALGLIYSYVILRYSVWMDNFSIVRLKQLTCYLWTISYQHCWGFINVEIIYHSKPVKYIIHS